MKDKSVTGYIIKEEYNYVKYKYEFKYVSKAN